MLLVTGYLEVCVKRSVDSRMSVVMHVISVSTSLPTSRSRSIAAIFSLNFYSVYRFAEASLRCRGSIIV